MVLNEIGVKASKSGTSTVYRSSREVDCEVHRRTRERDSEIERAWEACRDSCLCQAQQCEAPRHIRLSCIASGPTRRESGAPLHNGEATTANGGPSTPHARNKPHSSATSTRNNI